MNEERYQQYLNLIDSILQADSNEQLQQLFIENQNLMDEGLIQTMLYLADNAEAEDKNIANYLRNFANNLYQAINAENNQPTEADYNFLMDLLRLVAETNGNKEQVYPFLQQNLNYLTPPLIPCLNYWWQNNISNQTDSETKNYYANVLIVLGNRLQEFPFNKPHCLEIAIQCYENALLERKREVVPLQWATTQNNLGNAYLYRIKGDRGENLEKAIRCYENALLEWKREVVPLEWAMTQNNLGTAYLDRIKGDRGENLEKAIQCYENALLEWKREVVPLNWATTQNNLANAYCDRIKGDRGENLETAIQCYENALLERKREVVPLDWATTQNNLAIAYQNRIKGDKGENLEKAIECYENALLEWKREVVPLNWATTQNNLANAYCDRIKGDRGENLETAIQCYENALLERKREVVPLDWATTQNNLAIAYQNRIKGDRGENLEKAIRCYENALLERKREVVPLQWATTQNNLATAYNDRIKGDRGENLEKAIQCYENALSIYTPETVPLTCLTIRRNLGNLYYEEGNWEKAIDSYTIAIEIIEDSRLQTRDEKRRQDIIAENLGVYEKMIQSLVEIGNINQALEYVERTKARNLVELLATKDLYPKGEIPEAVKQKLNKLRQAIRVEQRRLNLEGDNRNLNQSEGGETRGLSGQMQSQSTSQPSLLPELQRQLDQLIKNEIENIDNTFSLTQKVEGIKIREMQSLIPDQETVILEWYFTDEFIYCFIITKERIILHPPSPNLIPPNPPSEGGDLLEEGESDNLPLSKGDKRGISKSEELRKLTNKYYLSYTAEDDQDKTRWQNQLPEILSELKEIVAIEDILAQLRQIQPETNRLILIPYRFLHIFPIHALLPLEDFPQGISYAPSCQVLNAISNPPNPPSKVGNLDTGENLSIPSTTSKGGDLEKEDNLQAMGKEVPFSKGDLGGSQFLAIQNPIQDLIYTDLEVETIAQYFQPDAQILPYQQATKENLTSQPLDKTNYLHFSCHGYFNFNQPMQSALILADCFLNPPPTEPNPTRHLSLRDGKVIDLQSCLTLSDIFELDLRQCQLVSLSACETGVSDILNQNDEYISLPSGFLYAGSTNVISTLWAVSDLTTALLMIRFYELYHDNSEQSVTCHNSRLALYHAQIWLKNSTASELLTWVKKLPSCGARRSLIAYLNSDKIEKNKPLFQSPQYWAAFCNVGF